MLSPAVPLALTISFLPRAKQANAVCTKIFHIWSFKVAYIDFSIVAAVLKSSLYLKLLCTEIVIWRVDPEQTKPTKNITNMES